MGLSATLLQAIVAALAVVLLLPGCAVVPGNDAYTLRTTKTSSVKLPVKTPQGEIPANIKVQEITAELIIEKEKTLYPQPPKRHQPTPHSDYRVGPGDILSIIVWDHPELTIPAGEFRSAEQSGTVVAEDGTIFFPYAGVLKVAGRTLREVRSILTQKLSPVIENVQLEVRIAQYRSQRIYVVGEVGTPGIVTITDIPMTMVEAVNQSGGFSKEADQRNITVTRDGDTFRVNLLALYEQGDTTQNIRLAHGDVVNVPDRQFNKIFVLGEILGPGSYFMNKGRMTLAEVLSDAGNVDQFTANPHQIFVLRGGERPEIFHLSSKEPDALLLADRFPLQARDVVYVDTADLIRWNKFISALLPTTNLLTNWRNLDFRLFQSQE